MARAKLNIKDIVGNVFDNYSKDYQDLVNHFKSENVAAGMLREDLKNERINRNKESSLAKAYELSDSLKKELISKLETEKTKYAKLHEEKKNEAAQQAEKVFSGHSSNNTEALKLLYGSIEKNTKVMQATKILDLGYTPAIEKLIDQNEGNEDILQIVEPYINKNIKHGDTTEYNILQSKLQNARTTEVDDIANMLKAVKSVDMQMGQFPTLNELNMVTGRSIPNDFNNNNTISIGDAKASYFG